MHRYTRTLLILAAITFGLAAPTPVQEMRQVDVNAVHLPQGETAVLRKRIGPDDLDVLWDDWWHYENVLGEPAPQLKMNELHVTLASTTHGPVGPESDVVGNALHWQDGLSSGGPSSEASLSSSTSLELDDGWPPGSPEPGHSSTESESDPSTISNAAPGVSSQSENSKATDSGSQGKTKVGRHISGIASGFDSVQMELRSGVDPWV